MLRSSHARALASDALVVIDDRVQDRAETGTGQSAARDRVHLRVLETPPSWPMVAFVVGIALAVAAALAALVVVGVALVLHRGFDVRPRGLPEVEPAAWYELTWTEKAGLGCTALVGVAVVVACAGFAKDWIRERRTRRRLFVEVRDSGFVHQYFAGDATPRRTWIPVERIEAVEYVVPSNDVVHAFVRIRFRQPTGERGVYELPAGYGHRADLGEAIAAALRAAGRPVPMRRVSEK
ncbi:MAG: hypothetical protein NZ898_02830 [Myxococcota bacterium]|nr:hypothetical protein [Myxococcota bacterium]MDW8361308.1 hypothetical protein [Myxococcales bacterium]